MDYVTDRKRAEGLGSAKSGTAHHWSMTVTSWALIVLVPLFVFTFGPMLGESHEAVLDYFARPFPAIVAALTLLVGMHHFRKGAQTAVEDYVHGGTGRFIIIAVTCLAYALAAAGLFAIAKIAL